MSDSLLLKQPRKKNISKAVIYFFLSTVFTWWFIAASPLYISNEQKLLSCSIAGSKWLLQILAALFFLGNKKWIFIKNISSTCLIGSLLLLPFCVGDFLKISTNASFFIASLITAVCVMIVSYYYNVKKSEVKISWWYFWLACLTIAISLQLTIVFHVSWF